MLRTGGAERPTPRTAPSKKIKLLFMRNNNKSSVNEVKNDNLVFVAEKPWLSVVEFSKYTGYKVSYVYKLISERRVPYYKRDGGKNVFFLKDEIDKWILGRRIAPMEELNEEAARYVAKNSVEDVVFRPSRRIIGDDEDEEKPKKKSATTSKKKTSTKAKAKDEPTPKDKKGAKKPSTKKSKAKEESSKKGKKEVKKTSTKRKPTTKKKKR